MTIFCFRRNILKLKYFKNYFPNFFSSFLFQLKSLGKGSNGTIFVYQRRGEKKREKKKGNFDSLA